MRVILVMATVMVAAQCCNAAGRILVREEAENWSAQGGGEVRVLNNADASGGKTVSYWEEHGVWLEVEMTVAEAGEYLLTLGYALNWPQTTRAVLLNGERIGTITLPTTGGWSVFSTVTTNIPPIPLQPGTHTLRFLNEDSLGLSLDWVALHTPDVFFGDRALSSGEMEQLLSELNPQFDPVAERTLSLRQVQVHFDLAGTAGRAMLHTVHMATHMLPDTRLSQFSLKETDNFRIAVLPGHLAQIWITDGRNLYLVAIPADTYDIAIPGPILSDGLRAVTAQLPGGAHFNLAAAGWTPHMTEHLELGTLHLTAYPGLTIGPWDNDIPLVRIELQPLSDRHIGAVKWSKRWGPDQPAIGIVQQPDSIIIRESATRFNTLSRFYGEKQFDLEIRAAKLRFLDIESGQVLVLSFE